MDFFEWSVLLAVAPQIAVVSTKVAKISAYADQATNFTQKQQQQQSISY